MANLIKNEFYLLRANRWVYGLYMMFAAYYLILVLIGIIAGPQNIDREFLLHYPLLQFSWLVELPLPLIAWYIVYRIFHSGLWDKSLGNELLKAWPRPCVFFAKVIASLLCYAFVYMSTFIVSYIIGFVAYAFMNMDIPLYGVGLDGLAAFCFVARNFFLLYIAGQPLIMLALLLALLIRHQVLYMTAFVISLHVLRFAHLFFDDISWPFSRLIFTYYEKGFISFFEVPFEGTKMMIYESNFWLLTIGVAVCIIASMIFGYLSLSIFKKKDI